ncbi:MAG TPA: M20/M25/M40 family metallo-hydrolase [Gemmatimonadaceae bacterium]|nr:M20/M25/M40 family metallo-hydrolase [Gemmatimonadaceae bacterium]
MAALCAVATSATAQVTETVADWIQLDAPPGQEGSATSIISASLPGWTTDAMGNLIKHVGSGSPRRVVSCGLDNGGYIVSEITDAGYLRLAAPERNTHSPLWDQFHEGQRVRVLTKHGALPGVIAVKSTHLWRRRSTPETPVTIDDLWLDVGARSRAEVEQMGIQILDPVLKQWSPWRYSDYVSGPDAGSRAMCAILAGAASSQPTRPGETIFVISVQHSYNNAGLASVLAHLGRVDTVVVLGSTPLTLPVRYPGTLVESVQESDVKAFATRVADVAGVASAMPVALKGVPTVPPTAPSTPDSLSAVADLLTQVGSVYGPSGHEGDVRRTVRGLIPKPWSALNPTVDTAGNLVVAAGPHKDTVVFVAHLDELGFDIVRIEHDGRVVLKPLGGFYPSLWEGQRALLHEVTKCDTPMRGVFVPRDKATVKQPDTLSAWFGVDSVALAACGVHVGQGVTSTKHPTRLGSTRYSVRALDDRTGVTSLLLAMQHIDPTKLDHTVIFAFSTREEVGLNGAAALAAQFGTSVKRVHAVDTFVSSDSPLESQRFAYAPIGAGAVERAHDNSSVTPAAEVERVRRIAESGHIPLQIGTTNGGNDGSVFVNYGAVDVPLAWPLRYSHSPAEVIDLSDLHALGLLIAAVAVAPVR